MLKTERSSQTDLQKYLLSLHTKDKLWRGGGRGVQDIWILNTNDNNLWSHKWEQHIYIDYVVTEALSLSKV